MHTFWKVTAVKFLCVAAIIWAMYDKYQATLDTSAYANTSAHARIMAASRRLFIFIVIFAAASFAMDAYVDWHTTWTQRHLERARWQIMWMMIAAIFAAVFTIV